MIVAVTAQQGRMDAQVDLRFGRAAFFMLADTQTMEVSAYDNIAGVDAGNGAGTGASQLMSEHGVDVLYTGKVGPKAADVLERAGIRVVEVTEGTVSEILTKAWQDSLPVSEGKSEGDRPDFVVQPAEPIAEGAVRVAIPTETSAGLAAPRSGHFGKCAYYTLVDVADTRVVAVQSMRNGGHISGGCSVPVMLLKGWCVDRVVVAGIGGRPLMGFRQAGIEVYGGHGSTVQETIDAYLAGRIGPIGMDQVCGGGPAV